MEGKGGEGRNTYLFGTEVIERSEEDGQGGVDADDPGEGEDVIHQSQEDRDFDE